MPPAPGVAVFQSSGRAGAAFCQRRGVKMSLPFSRGSLISSGGGGRGGMDIKKKAVAA